MTDGELCRAYNKYLTLFRVYDFKLKFIFLIKQQICRVANMYGWYADISHTRRHPIVPIQIINFLSYYVPIPISCRLHRAFLTKIFVPCCPALSQSNLFFMTMFSQLTVLYVSAHGVTAGAYWGWGFKLLPPTQMKEQSSHQYKWYTSLWHNVSTGI